MVSEKKHENMLSFSHRAKDGVWKVWLLFCRFFKIYFWENKSYFDRGWKRVYTRHKLTDLLCISIDWFLYVKTERYFLTDYSYILENHFYFVNVPDYCFKPFLSRIFCVNSSVKILSPQYEGPSTHIFRTSSLCTFSIYRKKIDRFLS